MVAPTYHSEVMPVTTVHVFLYMLCKYRYGICIYVFTVCQSAIAVIRNVSQVIV